MKILHKAFRDQNSFTNPFSSARIGRALTLVELMVSMFALAIMAVSILYGFIGTKRVAEATMTHSLMAEVAQSYLEQIKRMNYDTLRNVIDDPVTNKLDTYRTDSVGFTSNVVPSPLTVGQDNVIQITKDVLRDGFVASIEMTIRPELRDLTNTSSLLPAIEVILHYSYTSASVIDGMPINRRVQYVIPRLGQPAAASS